MSNKGVDLRNVRAKNITISGVSISPTVARVSNELRRIHYMTGDRGFRYTERPEEYEQAKRSLLGGGRTVALTTALHGAGGYGKTTLANAISCDPDIRREFCGGVLRVELSKEIDDVTGKVLSLVDLIAPGHQSSRVTDIAVASELLAQAIGDARILLVIDDVWREAQLRPFRGGSNCVRLVTTRIPNVLPPDHVAIPIDQMTMGQALEILSSGLPDTTNRAINFRLCALAERVGLWAQMLAIASGWITARIRKGQSPTSAIAEFEARFDPPRACRVRPEE
jgi:hypothetical protein